MVPIILIVLAVVLWLQVPAVDAYGPINEACTTTGTQVSGTAAQVKAAIEGAAPGTTLLVRAGTYTFAAGTPLLGIPARVTVKPYNCEAVTFQGTSAGAPYSGVFVDITSGTAAQPTTIAGITMQGTYTGAIGQGQCTRIVHEHMMNFQGKSNITLRHNNIYGGARDAIVIENSSTNLLFQGNDINSGPAKPGGCGLPGSTGGHVFKIGQVGTKPTNITIRQNQIQGSYFGDVMHGDDMIAVSRGDNVVIEGNSFVNGLNYEDIIDIKTRETSLVPVIVRQNWFHGPTMGGTKGGQGNSADCLNLGGNYCAPHCLVMGDWFGAGTTVHHVVERNVFDRCKRTSIGIGGGDRYSGGIFRNNLVVGTTADPAGVTGAGNGGIGIGFAVNTRWVNNIFLNTPLLLGWRNGCRPTGAVLRNNIFYNARIDDDTPECATDKAYTATHNMVFSTVGGSGWDTNTSSNTAATVNNNLNTDPLFVDAAGTGVTDRNFNLQAGSPALNSGIAVAGVTLASIGTINRGMFEQPTMGACSTVDADTDTCSVNAIHTPIQVTCGSLTPEVGGANRTASGCAVTGSTVTYNVSGAGRPGPPTVLTLNVATAGIADNALIGDLLRGEMIAVTDQAVTNTISVTAPAITACFVGDAAPDHILVTINTQGSPPLLPATACTGFTARTDTDATPDNWVVSSCTRLADNQLDLDMATNATAGDGLDISYSQGTGNVTNTAGVEVAAATNFACTNNVGTTAPTFVSGVVKQTAPAQVVLTFEAGTSTPMLPATGATGVTCRTDVDATPDNWPLTSCSRTADEEFTCMATSDAIAGDGLDCSYSQATGNITNQAATELTAFTNQTITNSVVPGSGGTVTQAHCRCAYPHRAETATRWHAGEDLSCEVTPTGTVAVVCQLRCSGADCPAQGYTWWASDNGGAAYLVENDFGVNRLAYATDEVSDDGDPTTRQLTSCTHVAGSVYVNPRQAVFPALAIPNGQCSEYRGVFRVSPTATLGQPVTVGLQKDGGGGVTQTVLQTLTIIGARGQF